VGFPTGDGGKSSSSSKPEGNIRPTDERVEEIKSTIMLEDLVFDVPGGPKVGMVGESKSGKTVSSISSVFMNKEFIPSLMEAGLVNVADALKHNIIPNVKRVVIIDTENAIKTQLSYPYERNMFTSVGDRIKRIGVDIPALKEAVDSDTEEVNYDMVSVEEVTKAMDDIIAAVEWCVDNLDREDVIIFDSASDYQVLLHIVTGFIANLKARKTTDSDEKTEFRYNRWTNRTSLWSASMRKLRSFPGWVFTTFKKKRNKKWIIKAFNKPLLEPLWLEGTEYNYDMVYDFSIERNTNVRIVEPMEGRYVNTDNPDFDRVEIYGKIEGEEDKYQFLKVIDNMLAIQKGGRSEWQI